MSRAAIPNSSAFGALSGFCWGTPASLWTGLVTAVGSNCAKDGVTHSSKPRKCPPQGQPNEMRASARRPRLAFPSCPTFTQISHGHPKSAEVFAPIRPRDQSFRTGLGSILILYDDQVRDQETGL